MNKFQCQLCFQNLYEYRMARLCSCDHVYCEECLIEYIEQKLKNFQLITCPEENCKGKLDENCGLMASLTPSQTKKYQIIKFRKIVETNQNWILCPTQACEKGVIIVKERNNTIGRCKECKVKFCLKCMKQKHKGKCEDAEAIINLQKNFNFKKCPTCQRLVERSTGCDHMTCKCRGEFCFKCEKKWSANHSCKELKMNELIEMEKQDNNSIPSKILDPENIKIEEEKNYEDRSPIYSKILRKLNDFCLFRKVGHSTSTCQKIYVYPLTVLYYLTFALVFLLWIVLSINLILICTILVYVVYIGKTIIAFTQQICRIDNLCAKICAGFFVILLSPLILLIFPFIIFNNDKDNKYEKYCTFCFEGLARKIIIYKKSHESIRNRERIEKKREIERKKRKILQERVNQWKAKRSKIYRQEQEKEWNNHIKYLQAQQ